MDLRSYRLGPVKFEVPGPGRVGDFGYFIDPDGAGGLDGVGMSLEQTKIPGGRGSFAFGGELDSRTIPIAGLAHAKSPRELRVMRDEFTGLLWRGDVEELLVDFTDETYSIGVQRMGSPPSFKPVGALRDDQDAYAVFQIQLWAPDPLMFGEEIVTPLVAAGEVVPIGHRGNTGSPARFTITHSFGTVTNYTIWRGSDQYSVTRPVEPGHPHTVDMDTGDLIIDGQVVLGGRGNATTWLINDGDPQNHVLGVGGGGSASLQARVRNAIA